MTKRHNNLRRILWAVAAVVYCSCSLWGQTKDTIVGGQVTDATGAVVPAVTVTLTSQGGAVLERARRIYFPSSAGRDIHRRD